MIYGIDELVRRVKVSIDQNCSSEALLEEGDIDTLTLDEIIREKMCEAVRRVHLAAPARLLEEGHLLEGELHWGELESGWTPLPGDYLRLVVFKMSDWEAPVYEAITPDDARYALQRQRVKALRGTAQHPVCALVNRHEGRVLEYYSCKSYDAYMELGMYIPEPVIDRDGGVDISPRCVDAAVLLCASLALQALGAGERSEMLRQTAEKNLE